MIELKKFCIEEWNQINPRYYFKNYLRRDNIVLALTGDRILDAHIKQIIKIVKKESEKEEAEDEEEENVTEIINRKIRRVFNEVFLNNLKNQEIRNLKRKRIIKIKLKQ